ncbi:DUF6495 family protein [Aquimarina agarivorans]|uniref:DUF6495 family protein n=1 Tax=Aquimarina agarivorans TaxID=980584 RepID=UPI000248E7F2|nr:DUF6495 family protein [Aquimarina agarivorans]
MKYARLSKEQLEDLHQEFINFLATQSITADEWSEIKNNKPGVAEEEIDVFSDMIWEGVLNKVEFLEHFSKDQIHLFFLTEEKMHLIAIKVNNKSIDLLTDEGYKWLQQNLMDDSVAFFNATKEYTEDKNIDKFKIIEQGANITKGDLYSYFAKLLDKKKDS